MNTENNFLSTFQWFIYLLAYSIALPIVIGHVFALSGTEISALMQRTFFIVGLSSFMQVKFGHRFPIADGPAGSWVSIFVIYASIGTQNGLPMMETLQTLEAGLIVAGLLLFLLGITKWVRHLLFLFSPIVTGTFLFILALQLSGVFFKGMVSRDGSTGQLDGVSFLLAILIFFLIIILSAKAKGWLKNYAILLGILAGWISFLIFGKGDQGISMSSDNIQLPEIFPWGFPTITGGVLVTAILFTFLLISNTIAAISAAEEVNPNIKGHFHAKLNRGTWVGGVSHLFSALFSTIAVVPLPATAGFVRLTKQYRIIPFLFACGMMVIISLFPSIVGLLASLPLPVASAALLATLIEMLGISIRSLTKQPLNDRDITIIGVSLLFGIGTMFLPDDIFNGLPSIIQNIGKNGLLIGTFLAIIFEQLWKSKN
ncbi:purine/pyrimidine permease [Bacillus sp. sid0103]|uniref:purine/pyrimidine permease n=1 Tax=Bacillus sp. sid0103 TaxID=2856337 RepID=UPI001C492A19|nr:purine/pyrimidine permease [Bacillus sp. sid0103]MBV7505501.1 purine/pyrimidine permease [Bacillus sp. sid0103]